ncbi:MAG: hypothetical protein IBX43_10030 [Campylobacterales bacterium]|nr:hypothetical protein [Campylobacterales bacterium]
MTGVSYGIFALLLFYALASARSRNHLFYLLFLAFFALTKLSFDGLGSIVLESDFYWALMQERDLLVGIMILFFILFSRNFLKTETFSPKIDKLLLFLALAVSVLTLGALFFSFVEATMIMGGISLILLPLLLLLSISAYKNKFYPARLWCRGGIIFAGRHYACNAELRMDRGFLFLLIYTADRFCFSDDISPLCVGGSFKEESI